MSIVQNGKILFHTPKSFADEVKSAVPVNSKLINGMRIKDRQQALERFEWNLDPGTSGLKINFDGLMIETYLYERGYIGSGVVEPGTLDIFPVAWAGGIDRYRRMRKMKPIFPTGSTDKGEITEAPYDKEFEIVYLPDDEKKGEMYGAVLYDYSPGINRNGLLARKYIQEEIIKEQAAVYNMSTISLINSLAIAKYRVDDQDQRDAIEAELRAFSTDIQKGKFYQLLMARFDLQDLTTPATYQGQEYWQTFDSLDQLRLGWLGHENTGAFNKKERKLSNESEVETSNSDLVIGNSCRERQRFVDVVNSTYGVNFSFNVKKIEAEANEEEEEKEGGEQDESERLSDV